MQRLQAYQYEILPNGEQQRRMRRTAGSCRFVFNKALALQQERYERGEKKLSYAGLCQWLTQWRNGTETPWLADAPTHPLQQALKDLERAYQNFFARRAHFPRFKRKGRRERFRYPDAQQFKVDQINNRLFLPKLGWLRYRNSRAMLGVAKNITLSECCGRWYASIQTERAVEAPVPSSTRDVGIDLGIARLATLSDGSHVAPLDSFRKHETRLRRYQRPMSRKVKPQLAQGQKESAGHPRPNRPCPTRLPAQGHDHDQPKPRDGVYRGPPGKEHVPVEQGQRGDTG